MVRQLIHRLWQLPRSLAIGALTLYQKTLSPDHGPLKHLYPYGYCVHEPTCSEYGKKMLGKRGFVIGSVLLMGQLVTCHPWRRPSDAKIRKITAQLSSSQTQ